jgi:hypothetical protein
MFMIPDADSLVSYLKDFTGSTNDDEIKQCIFQAKLGMRNIELPALRTNPYETFGTVGANQLMPIPTDMNKPILFFMIGMSPNQASPPSSNTGYGPWIVFDRIGDRDIITQGLMSQFYLSPVNVPAVVRGKFSEVGSNYQFLPYIADGTIINMYYYRAWDLLFTPATTNTIISTTGTVGSISPSDPWTCTISGMTSSTAFAVGDIVTATAGTGTLTNGGIATVASKPSSTSLIVTVTGGTTPTAGTITNVTQSVATTIQTNPVLQSFPEGYIYGSLTEYYIKRRSQDDAALFKSRYDEAWNIIEDQNNLGKWSGGHTRMTSIFQPRQASQFSLK